MVMLSVRQPVRDEGFDRRHTHRDREWFPGNHRDRCARSCSDDRSYEGSRWPKDRCGFAGLHAGASLQAAREKYAGKVTFVSVGVPANQTPEKQKAYVEEKKLTGVFTFDRSSAAMKAFAVPHTSYIVIVGTDRRVTYTGVGDDQDIDAVLAKLGTR
jgi:hypothetical protein